MPVGETGCVPRLRCLALSTLASASLAFGGVGNSSAQDDATTLIVELLGDKDKDVRALALEQVRTEAKGEAVTRTFADLLPTLVPEAQVGLLAALASRGDAAAAPAIRKLLADTPQETVKIAAIESLGFLGGGDDAGLLIKILATNEPAQQKAARASLERLPGESAVTALTAAMQSVSASQRVMLIEILARRRAGVDEMLRAVVDDEAAVRGAAMMALGELAGPEHLSAMAPGVLKARPGSERTAAERAVASVCRRIPDVPQQAAPWLAIMDASTGADRAILLQAAGRVGGPAVLAAAEEALENADPVLHAAGLAALCNWPDGSIDARLLELARTEPHADHRRLARKALIRVAPLPDARTDQRRLDLLRTAFVMCADEAEQNMVLERAKSIRTLEALRFTAAYLDRPSFAQQACETVVELAHHRQLREPNKSEFDRLLDRVSEISRDATVIDRAQRYKKGQTWVRPRSSDSNGSATREQTPGE